MFHYFFTLPPDPGPYRRPPWPSFGLPYCGKHSTADLTLTGETIDPNNTNLKLHHKAVNEDETCDLDFIDLWAFNSYKRTNMEFSQGLLLTNR